MRGLSMLMWAGTITWLSVGATMAVSHVLHPGAAELWRHGAWWAAWLVFGAAFWLQGESGGSAGASAWGRALAVTQVAAALVANALVVMPMPGMPLGSALAVVAAARVATVFPGWLSGLIVGAQTAALVWIYRADGWPLSIALMVASAFGGFMMFAAAVSRLADREREAGRLLAAALRDLRATQAAREVDARRNERLAVMRDMHDTLGHHLAALSLRLEAAGDERPGAQRDAIDAARGIVRGMMGDVRRIVSVERASLAEDLRDVVARMSDGHHRPVVRLTMPEQMQVPDAAAGAAAFRIVQEAITNAVRHADAGSVEVACAIEGSELVVRVRDDGRGMADGVGQGAGRGLSFMRSRAQELGGTLSVGAAEGGGVEVVARLPLRGDRA